MNRSSEVDDVNSFCGTCQIKRSRRVRAVEVSKSLPKVIGYTILVQDPEMSGASS